MRKHPALTTALGIVSILLPALLIRPHSGAICEAFFWWIIPLAMQAAQAVAAKNNRDAMYEVPFDQIPAGRGEKLINKADQAAWHQLIDQFNGSPVHVLSNMDEMRSGYGTSDALGATEGPSDPAYSGAYDRGAQAAQDATAKGVNANAGQAMHAWAMAGKIGSAQRRNEVQQAIDQMKLAYKMNNKATLQNATNAVNQSYAQLAKTGMGVLGDYLGGMGNPSLASGSANTGTMAGFNSAGQVTPSPYNPWRWTFAG